ncbi:ATP synthase I chain [Syntrophus gentianae]|uniref:ATP synthase I chain n=1 Tax=Syntrophus gentianae TaxID=43775 RepID=A0A1H7Z4X8_9BACT|nr:ATP synthase subunit I [Syntrophus gentianae]SEM53335.1 ATP synthase I chain [Syntrophus gentianae]
MDPIEKAPLQRKLEITNWVVLGLLILGSTILQSFHFSLGVLLGGLISIVNFYWLHQNLRNTFQRLMDGSKSSILLKYCVRLAVTAVILYLIIAYRIADVLGLLLGLSIVVINMVFTVIMTFHKKNFEEVS